MSVVCYGPLEAWYESEPHGARLVRVMGRFAFIHCDEGATSCMYKSGEVDCTAIAPLLWYGKAWVAVCGAWWMLLKPGVWSEFPSYADS